MFITAVVALIALVAGVAYGTTASEGADALADWFCAGEGGTDEAIWWGEGRGRYGVLITCNSGSVFVTGFRCAGCDE